MKKSEKLFYKLVEKENFKGTGTRPIGSRDDFIRLFKLASLEEEFFLARLTAGCINEKFYSPESSEGSSFNFIEEMAELGHKSMKAGNYYHAQYIFNDIGEEELVKKATIKFLVTNKNKGDYSTLTDDWFINLIDLRTDKKFYHKLKSWSKGYGLEPTKIANIINTANVAYNLRKEYDIAIGVARGGLSSAYIFKLMGHDTRIVETHRDDESNKVIFHDEIFDIVDKNVLIIDYDIVTGNTSKRIMDAVKEFSPKRLDYFIDWPPYPKDWGTDDVIKLSQEQNLPKSYGKLQHGGLFGFESVEKVCSMLEKKLFEIE